MYIEIKGTILKIQDLLVVGKNGLVITFYYSNKESFDILFESEHDRDQIFDQISKYLKSEYITIHQNEPHTLEVRKPDVFGKLSWYNNCLYPKDNRNILIETINGDFYAKSTSIYQHAVKRWAYLP